MSDRTAVIHYWFRIFLSFGMGLESHIPTWIKSSKKQKDVSNNYTYLFMFVIINLTVNIVVIIKIANRTYNKIEEL